MNSTVVRVSIEKRNIDIVVGQRMSYSDNPYYTGQDPVIENRTEPHEFFVASGAGARAVGDTYNEALVAITRKIQAQLGDVQIEVQ